MSTNDSNPSNVDSVLREATWLRGFVQRLVSSEAEALDVTQDALRVALEDQSAAGSNPGRGRLAGIARNIALNRRRAEGRRRQREARAREDAPALSPSPDEEMERLELLRSVLAGIQTLPPSQRRAITLRFVDGLEPRAIAEATGTTPGTVRSHIARGLEALRERLDRTTPGGRSRWTAVLAPWAVQTRTALVGAQVAAVTTAGLSIIMLKTFIAACAAVILAGVWFSTRPAQEAASAARDVDATESSASLAEPELPEAARAVPGSHGVELDAPPVEETSAAEAPTASQVAAPGTFYTTVVDRLTGEPVPYMDLRIAQAQTESPPDNQVYTTDAEGKINLTGGPFAEGFLRIIEADAVGSMAYSDPVVHGAVPFPFTGVLEVSVGPTFWFEWNEDDDAGPHPSYWQLEFVWGEGLSGGVGTKARRGAPGDKFPVFARFPAMVTELAADRPMSVTAKDKSGFAWASAPVGRTRGIEAAPIRFEFELRGALQFNLEESPEVGRAPHVIVRSLAPAESDAPPHYAFLIAKRKGAVAKGRVGALAPGDYAWTFGIGPNAQTGVALVEPGVALKIELDPAVVAATFSSYILVDASARPDARVGDWLALAMAEGGVSGATMFSPEKDPADPPHHWRVRLNDLLEGNWDVWLQPMGGAEIENEIVRVSPGSLPPTMRLLPEPEGTALTLRVVDSETGERIADAEACINDHDGGPESPCTRGEDGDLVFAGIRADRATELLVRAPGYRLEAVRHNPVDEGVERTVRLARGWRNQVRALHVFGQRPVEGAAVMVDGLRVGETGAGGVLWIDGATAPDSVRIDPAGTGLFPAGPPDTAKDPLAGWTFLLM